MDGRLRPAAPVPARALASALGLAALVLVVLALHAGLLSAWQAWRPQAAAASPEPPRLRAAFVRQMLPAQPAAASHLAHPATARRQVSRLPAGETAEAADAADAAPQRLPPEAWPGPDSEPAVLAPPVPLPPLQSFQAGAEWPLSTELHYRLSGQVRGPVHGRARVQWLRQGEHYQMHLEVQVGPAIAPLVARRMSSDGLLTPHGIAPRRYDEATSGLLVAQRHQTLLFRPGQVQLADGRGEPVGEGAQDSASQFVQLSWLALTGRLALAPGAVVELPLALPRRVHPWRYEVQGEVLLDTPLGPLKTWHLQPRVAALPGAMQAEVWLAPALQQLPVRILIRHDAQQHIDLQLERAPLQAADL
jgi:hypothetical protein